MTRLSRIWLGAEGVIIIQSAAAPKTEDLRGRRRCSVSNVSIPSDSA